MESALEFLTLHTGLAADQLALVGIATAALLITYAAVSSAARRNPAAERLSVMAEGRGGRRRDLGLLRAPDKAEKGFMKAFVPTNASERTSLQQRLAQAGFSQAGALRAFTLVRVILGLLLPALLLLLILASRTPGMMPPNPVSESVATWSNLKVFQVLSGLVWFGYFLPLYILNSRVAARRRRIEEAFPNALDLMRISVDSGLGFDAAMTRVGNELAEVSPDLAFEWLSVQRQVQAGRQREHALQDMAARTGVEMMRSFSNTVLQSMQFGTSMSSALATYAGDLREQREMRAQEMANKLPVKMSAVLASLMLPALVLLTIGPVVIRYIRYFGG